MDNTFITADLIARESLPILRNNTVMPELVHTDYSMDFKDVGDIVQVKKPAVFTAIEFDGDVTGQEQAVTETKVDVKLDKIATIDIDLESKELTLNIQDFTAQIIEPAMAAIAQKIDSDITDLYADVPYYYGVSGTTPNELLDISRTRKVLMNNKTPNDNNLRLVIDEDAEAEFLGLSALADVSAAGTSAALRDASLGRVYKMNIYMDQNIKTHTAGTFTAVATPTVNGTISSGATTITMTGGAGTETIVAGDIFTISGQQYVATANAAAVGGDISVAVYPAVPAEIADTTAVTFADKTAGAHVANLAFHKNAFAFVSRPLALPMGGANAYVTNAENVPNVRVVMGYNQKTKKNMITFDLLYGTKTLYQELAARLLG